MGAPTENMFDEELLLNVDVTNLVRLASHLKMKLPHNLQQPRNFREHRKLVNRVLQKMESEELSAFS